MFNHNTPRLPLLPVTHNAVLHLATFVSLLPNSRNKTRLTSGSRMGNTTKWDAFPTRVTLWTSIETSNDTHVQ